jgi:engulfment and cell motility protein 1
MQDDPFAKKFLEKNGIAAITALIDELTGNTLAYVLSALQTAMSFDFGWDSLPQSFIEKMLAFSGVYLFNEEG